MNDNNIYKVGETYDNLKTNENNVFFVWNNHVGMRLIYRVSNPSEADLAFFETGRPFEIRWWTYEGVCLFAFRFGGINMWCESAFSPSPSLYVVGKSPIFPKKVNAGMGLPITITGINSSTGEVFGQRTIGLSHGFSEWWLLWANNQRKKFLSADRFNEIVDSVYDTHDASYIAEQAMAKEIEKAKAAKKWKVKKKVNYYIFSVDSSLIIE